MRLPSILAFVFALGSYSAPAKANPKVHGYRFAEGVTVSEADRYELKLEGYVQPWVEGVEFLGTGPEGLNQRFRLRRLRLRLEGHAFQRKVSFRFQVDLSGSSEVGEERSTFLLDAFVDYRPTKTLRITFGQRPTYTDNRELFMRSHTLQLVERSRVTSAFSAIREFGLFVQDRIRIGESAHYIRPYFVVTNGDGINAFAADRGGIKVGGRIDYLPNGLFYNKGQFRQADLVRELVPRLVVGVTYSYNMGMSSRRGRRNGDILYLNADDEDSLPNYGKLGVDFLFKYQGFSMLGEFVYTHADVPDDITQRVRNDGSISTTFDGSVESLVRGRMMLGRGYNIQAGYVFPFNTSIDARYTHLDADEDSFLNNGTFYNRPNYYTVGLTQYFDHNYGFKIQASVTYVDTAPGTNDFFSQSTDGDELDPPRRKHFEVLTVMNTMLRKGSLLFVVASGLACAAELQNPQAPRITEAFFYDPAPEVSVDTPAFQKSRGFTKHAELTSFLQDIVAGHEDVARLGDIGESQGGLRIPIVRLSTSSTTSSPLRVWFQGGLHGDEPASTEGMLLFLQRLLESPDRDRLLSAVELAVVPVANPDGYERQVRPALDGLDLNRDQTKLMAPESALLKGAFDEFDPHVAVDFHEYRAYRRDFIRFGEWGMSQIYDVMFLYSGNLNVPEVLRDYTQDVYVDRAKARMAELGLRHHDYITTRKVYGEVVFNQGSTNARASATNFALANTVSTLVEVRGVALNRSGFKRRTLTTCWVAESYLNTAAENVERTKAVLAESARATGPVVVKSRRASETATIEVLDLLNVQAIELEVQLRNALDSRPVLTRERPQAYVLWPSAEPLAERLDLLGLHVEVLALPRLMQVQGYEVTRRERGPYPYEGVVLQDVETRVFEREIEFPAGSFFIPMDQPRSAMAAELLEPEAKNGFVSFGVWQVQAGDELPIYRSVKE